jgi:uncharacterized SAM-binding protein YcdF (DUF218 family)
MLYLFLKRLLHPYLLLLIVAMLASLNLWRKRVESRKRLLWVSLPLAALYLWCTPAVAFLALGTLEWRFPPDSDLDGDAQAIVVLSGSIYPPTEFQSQAILGPSTLYRCLHAYDVYRAGPPRFLILTGGIVDPQREGPTLAEAMRDFMQQMGVPEQDLILETESRSTYENALYSAKVLGRRGVEKIILVTDATHLDRSTRCFAAQGIQAVPSGCRYRAAEFHWSLWSFLPDPAAAQDNQDVFHEWLGMLWYLLRGRI